MRVMYVVGSVVLGMGVLVTLIMALNTLPLGAPSRDTCIALWNAPRNSVLRAEVASRGYPTVDIDSVFQEGRYQGCSAWFVQGIREPWAIYSATRIPGEERPLEWVLDGHGPQWGISFPVPEPAPESDAVVLTDGSLSLGG